MIRFKFFKSLQWRLIFIFICIALVMVLILGTSLNRLVETAYYETFIEQVNSGFNNWQAGDNLSSDDIYEYLVEDNNGILLFLANQYKTFTIVEVDKREIVYSYYNRYSYEDYNRLLESANFIRALNGEIGNEKLLLKDESGTYFDYARRINDCIVYFRYDDVEWQAVIDRFNRIIFLSGMAALLVALFIGVLLSRTITQPIKSLMIGARDLAKGEFKKRIEVKSEDEIGQLSKTFNSMASELRKHIIEISSEKSKVETILKYMTDGIVAFNSTEDMIHINPAALNTLEEPKIDDNFTQFIKRFDLNIKLDDIEYLNSFSTIEENVEYKGKYLKLYFAPFFDADNDAEGAIIVIQDYTSILKLEAMRKDFVANVSHELKTPLTSIISYSETLLDGAVEDKDLAYSFLEVVNNESNRMNRLVSELLELSRMDNQKIKWNFEKVKIDILVKETTEKIRMDAQSKGLTLESYVLNDVSPIQIDKDKIIQVIQNILSNAIKYTESGGRIVVYIGTMNNFVYFKVSDTGIGMTKEDQERIFERFYRVDKARSRKLGGTGLGLSIAKEIVDAHKGQILVKSNPDDGTEVVVKLPM